MKKTRKTEVEQKTMEIHIRNSKLEEYETIETIMKQAQQMHIDWQPDLYIIVSSLRTSAKLIFRIFRHAR